MVVGEVQSAFIGGKNIQDGILIANDVVEEWKRSRKRDIIIKLDFEKAFDKVNWNYMLRMMDLMRFPQRWGDWRDWINECLSSARVFVLVNGSPCNEFQMNKGVRQGDPQSPFLVILAAEGLNWILKRAASLGSFSGLTKGIDGPGIEAFIELKELLVGSGVVSTSDRPDRLIWQGCSLGKFSVKFIYNIASSSHSSVDETFKLSWQNVAPPRVQCFGWLTYLGRVKIAESSIASLLSCLELLGFHPKVVWCGVSWVAPASLVSLFHWWRDWFWQPRVKVIWTPIPLTMMWSIYNARNQKVLDNKLVNWLETIDLIIARVAFWVSSSKDGLLGSDYSWISGYVDLYVFNGLSMTSSILAWVPFGCLALRVLGSFAASVG
ncbi:hypothetical protein Acr_27g0005560 [Actinidia rufa]|uniref:Reverse transcriptase domain-containing protein n=1 Tax=Actinidia rufa TaxID=165716 RepID=A0A7J0H6T2_9ERIC|nr:hypothetical protein Acr_27g0005560 [Actinidia rufa]